MAGCPAAPRHGSNAAHKEAALHQHMIAPLHIAGNTTEDQRDSLKRALAEALDRACSDSLRQLDSQSLRLVLEMNEALKTEISSAATKIIERLTATDKFIGEETDSLREYPPTYKVKPIEAQVTALRQAFPSLRTVNEKIARKPVPEGAEAWFAVPRWQAIAPSYGEAVEDMIDALSARRRVSNRVAGKVDARFLRQNDRTLAAERIIAEQQPGSDVLIVPAQLGMRFRGCSARRARLILAGNEFALGAFALGCLLITHPERLSHSETLMIDCAGDEYSLRGDAEFDRVPLFDFDLSGIEISIFYEDRSRSLWGTPTAFTVQISEPHRK